MLQTNTPYVYQLGLITKDKPFRNPFPNRRERRANLGREFNNSKSYPLVVTRIGKFAFAKYTKHIQLIPDVSVVKKKIVTRFNKKGNIKMKAIVNHIEC